tara:strand:+ start:762 stop:1025 length:264 start_codon:yes stop_codon:yes gene_type:complete
MDQIIKCLLLKNGDLLISQIMEIDTELGGPDCKMIKPYKMVKVEDEYKLETWLDFTSQSEMMIHSDSILTIVTPTPAILSEYVELIA